MPMPINGNQKPLPKRPVMPNRLSEPKTQENASANLKEPQKEIAKNEIKEPQVKQNANQEVVENKDENKQTENKEAPKKVGKKWIFWVFLFIVVLVAGAVAYYFLIYKNNGKKLDTPNFEIVQLANDTVIDVNEVKDASQYKYFVYDSNGTEIFSVSQKSNRLALTTVLRQAGVYSVKVQALAENEKFNSAISVAKNVENYVMPEVTNFYINGLDSVIIDGKTGYKTNTNLADDTISWQASSNVQKYQICYGADSITDQILKFEVTPSGSTASFALSNLYSRGGGIYNISIIAVAKDGTYLLDSNLLCNGETKVLLEYFETLPAPSSLSFNDNVLSFRLVRTQEYDGEFEITLVYSNKTEKYIVDATSVYNKTTGRFNVDLTEVFSAEVGRIEVKALGGNYLIASSTASVLV